MTRVVVSEAVSPLGEATATAGADGWSGLDAGLGTCENAGYVALPELVGVVSVILILSRNLELNRMACRNVGHVVRPSKPLFRTILGANDAAVVRGGQFPDQLSVLGVF